MGWMGGMRRVCRWRVVWSGTGLVCSRGVCYGSHRGPVGELLGRNVDVDGWS